MRKKILLSLLSIFVISSLFISCKDGETLPSSSNNVEVSKTYSYPFTGLETTEDPSNNTPFMAVVENSKQARPQSGLSFADIVYETSAEGGIPRFIAVYHSKMSEKIGPIRSIRPYFLTISKEYTLPIAHCGGSKEALSEVKNDTALMSLNEMSNGKYYYRDNSRKAPHNLYTSSDKILKAISDKQYNLSTKTPLKFNKEYFNNDNFKTSDNITVTPNKVYETTYKYKDGVYTKYMDGEVAKDAITNNDLTFSNVIVQKTDITLQTDNSHLNIDLVKDGEGYLFSQGKVIEIKWSKDSEFSSTRLYDLENNEVFLSPGNTIWNIVDSDSKITF
ncbi:DUF3048 domain-containing protein [Clostridium baratii]|uniref:Putative lipoprotein yerB n=1 Tax=Clostridium baratii TaxID=1561 RepID=A0A174UJT8_9CLOT|nr:DUF3048 domain-containing protein [Clostridium baratii]CUQ22824.1 Putative lipoprotein yerB precursor [Clostridium baratii]